jgi:hypothetical protein
MSQLETPKSKKMEFLVFEDALVEGELLRLYLYRRRVFADALVTHYQDKSSNGIVLCFDGEPETTPLNLLAIASTSTYRRTHHLARAHF